MAWEIGDSFDFYGTVSDATVAGTCWTSFGGGGNITTSGTRFGTGLCFVLPSTGAGALQSTTFGNDTTIFVNFAWNLGNSGGATVYFGFALRDSTNNQVGVYFQANGTVIVTNGAFNGTVLATWASQFAGNQWNHYQFKIVINNTTGSVEMRMNGATSNTQSVTGINTRNGSTNAYANNISFYDSAQGTNIDDFYLFNDQGAQPNTWQGDVRAVQLMPNANSGTPQWSASHMSTNASASPPPTTGVGQQVGIAANTTYYGYWTPLASGTVTSISPRFASAFTTFNMALYDSSGVGSAPGNLIATATAVSSPGFNTTYASAPDVAFNFSSPPTVTAGTLYYVAFKADTAANYWGNTSNTQGGEYPGNVYSESRTYSLGFKSVAGSGMSVNVGCMAVKFAGTVANPSNVSELRQDGDTSYVFTNTVNNLDLYGTAGLSTTPNAIINLALKSLVRMDDAGPHTYKNRLSSAGTTSDGSNLSLSSSYQWSWTNYPTDPNGGGAWTFSRVNGALIGPFDVL